MNKTLIVSFSDVIDPHVGLPAYKRLAAERLKVLNEMRLATSRKNNPVGIWDWIE